MIENDRQLRAAEEWIAYWKLNRSSEQSWIGNEQARQRVAELRRQIDEYRRRSGDPPAPPAASAAPLKQPEASAHTINRATSPIPGEGM